MKDLSENIREVMAYLDELFDAVKPFIDVSLVERKKKQLIDCEKAISRHPMSNEPLQKLFLNRKEKILLEIDHIESVQKEFPVFEIFLKKKLKEFQTRKLPEPEIKPTTEVLHQASFHPDFMKNMIIKGVVKPGAEIERNFNGKRYKAKILIDGRIRVKDGNEEFVFEDIHQAASHIKGKDVNGLDFWRIRNQIGHSLVRLSVYLR